MKKILYLYICLLLSATWPCTFAVAQDHRQRTEETVVMDVLAQLPSADKQKFDRNMLDLAVSGEKSVGILGRMLVPAGEGKNSMVEYAVSGLVAFVTAEGNEKYLPGVRAGLRHAIEACGFKAGKAFLISQLQLCAGKEDVDLLMNCLQDPDLASPAINALICTPGSENAILELAKNRKVSPVLVGYAVREKRLAEAEPYLLSWWPELRDDNERRMIASALAACGTWSSADVLSGYSVNDYVCLLGRLAADGADKEVLPAARKLLKHADTHIRTSAMQIVLAVRKPDIRKELQAVMKDRDREYRNAVLKFAAPYMTEELYTLLSRKFASCTADAKEDYIRFLGNNKVSSQVGFLTEQAAVGETASCAIAALGKIGGSEAADFLVSQLGGPYGDEAAAAVRSLKDDVSGRLVALLGSGDEKTVVRALQLLSARRAKAAADNVFGLLDSESEQIRSAAYDALDGVVSDKDVKRISDRANSSAAKEYRPQLQQAFMAAVRTLEGASCMNAVSPLMRASSDKAFYYPALVRADTDKAVGMLVAEYRSGASREEALEALLRMNHPSVADFLHELVKNGPDAPEAVVVRYLDFIRKSSASYPKKCGQYEEILGANASDAVKKSILSALADIPSARAFEMASRFLDDRPVAYEAASCVKAIASNKLSMIDYNLLEPALRKAMDIYSSAGSADDGYAVDEIRKLLNELKPSAPFVLPDEEKKQGFEVLFDGGNLSKWEGDTLGYRSVNGVIAVSADYGNAHNLYTKKQYRDFVFRFEFCFKTPGVNNGVGIRTPQGVDAAYHGMCEVQILDHDFSAYKNIAPYQVHGSAYGIIPAKRIVHRPVGEWSTEEIKVVGDHITVTVNGEVILDGNLREACQGHNVAPDGAKKNPYTIDGNNHPGMFNRQGHISFCGHGSGIMLRNIRILDLNKK